MADEENEPSLGRKHELNEPLLQQALRQVKDLKGQIEAEKLESESKLQEAARHIVELQDKLRLLENKNIQLKKKLPNGTVKSDDAATSIYNPCGKRISSPSISVECCPTSQTVSPIQHELLTEGDRLLPGESKCSSVPATTITEAKRDEQLGSTYSKVPELSAGTDMTPDDKIALFRSLFVGQQEAYAVRWESQWSNKSGYEPARDHIYATHVPDKTKKNGRCVTCPNRKITDEIVKHHLQGIKTIGIYPLLHDDTCSFLTIDLDEKKQKENLPPAERQPGWMPMEKTGANSLKGSAPEDSNLQRPAGHVPSWRDDALALLKAARAFNVPAYIERSRSGSGGHVWIFFEHPVPAAKARRLGDALIMKANQEQEQFRLPTYDRMFPNQDKLPKLGYGNLIALPLQKAPLANGNSAFLDEAMNPHSDQWMFLRSIKKMTRSALEDAGRQAIQQNAFLPSPRFIEIEDIDADAPWLIQPSGRDRDTILQQPLPKEIAVTLDNFVYVAKAHLSRNQLNRIERMAAFQNPEFYKNQALRLSTYKTPRFISCAVDFPQHLALPRGCLQTLTKLLEDSGAQAALDDRRFAGKKIKAEFVGNLRPEQSKAVQEMLKNDTGVLSAAPGFGKTVISAYCISKRKVNTLILVHRQQLLRQWKEKLELFLDMPPGSIGQIGGGKNKPTGIVDIATIQSLWTKDGIKDIVADYGQVIVDECHTAGAVKHEQVLRQVKAKYVMGVTATPTRADGHHPVVTMQCGPIRYRAGHDETTIKEFIVIPKESSTELPGYAADLGTQEILSFLIHQKSRNAMIVADVLQAVLENKSPLVLTKRKEHLSVLAEMLTGKVKNVLVYKGGLGKKQQKAFAEKIASIPENEPRVIVATGQAIGEGFDDVRLDTLFLAMPISWTGTLTQYAGRLHRPNEGKSMVQIYDYIDVEIGQLFGMFRKRQTTYKKLKYKMQPFMK